MAYIRKIRQLVGHQPLIMTSASGALVNEQEAVLLQERADTEQTVVRKFKEDAGIAVEPQRLLKILDHDTYTYPNGDVVQPVNAFYLVRRTTARQYPIKPSETVRTRYFGLHESPHFFNQQHAEMWAVLKEYLTNR